MMEPLFHVGDIVEIYKNDATKMRYGLEVIAC